MRDKLLTILVMVVLTGCRANPVDEVADTFTGDIRVAASMEEELTQMDLEQLCQEQIGSLVEMPFTPERTRGPLLTMPPVNELSRFTGSNMHATCTYDYYYWPVAQETFAQLGIQYAYSKSVWQEFYEVLGASMSAQLRDQGFEPYVLTEEWDTEPKLSMVRYVPDKGLREYVDVFMTRDEEVVLEMNIVEER